LKQLFWTKNKIRINKKGLFENQILAK